MEHREAEDWRIAVEVAKYAPNTGMVPMRCATALAVSAELVMLRDALAALVLLMDRQCCLTSEDWAAIEMARNVLGSKRA
jgi:hypothetical protein